jgi:hypothetical protein
MNDPRITLAASLSAAALALVTPAIASAQNDPAAVMLDETTLATVVTVDTPPAAAAQADQVEALKGMGFLMPDQIMIASVENGAGFAWDASSKDAFQSALDQVRVNDPNYSVTTLREYLTSAGVDPASVAGVQVTGNMVTIFQS